MKTTTVTTTTSTYDAAHIIPLAATVVCAYTHIGLMVGAYVKCTQSMTHDNWTIVQPLFIILLVISSIRALLAPVLACVSVRTIPSVQIQVVTTAVFVSLLVARKMLGVPNEVIIELGIASIL